VPELDWLDQTHEIFDSNVDRWESNERRLRGSDFVLDELRPFIFESRPTDAPTQRDAASPGEHYRQRQEQALYLNFPEMYVFAMSGHLMRNRPLPGEGLNFGELGEVRRARDYMLPTEAELIYYNADGVGVDGSQWDNFWLGAWRRAAATGHRWMFIEAPPQPAGNRGRQLQGFRPYIVEWSPSQVTNWHFERGRLAWAVVRVSQRNPMVVNGTLEGNESDLGYYLLVRAGVTALGAEFSGGGWWLYDGDKELMDQGNWSRTDGEIPMWPLFYERDTGMTSRDETFPSIPAMSRPGTTELGQAAVAYMNLSSAADYDAWEAAGSLKFLLGVDREAFNLASEIWRQGNQTVPVPVNEQGQIPQVMDASTGAVAAQVFDLLLGRKLKEAERLAVQEATSVPDSSGVSKEAGFGERKAPRLAYIASELEQSQNVAIHFLEKRFGHASPSGSVIWTREFEIVDIVDSIKQYFEIEEVAKIKSPTMGARLMVMVGKRRGFLPDSETEQKVLGEYEKSATDAQATKEALNTATRDAAAAGSGTPPGGPPRTDGVERSTPPLADVTA
jgi:hypothetical protein